METFFTKGSRTRLLALILMVVMAIFVIRLFYIQVIRHGYYSTQADSEQMRQFTLHAQRGEIYTMDDGVPTKLVMNETVYTVWVDPETVNEPDRIVEVIRRVAGGNARNNLDKLVRTENSRYQVVATKVSRTQAELIKKEKLEGVGFDAVSQRVYPEGKLGSQILGFVDAEGEGKYGFEQYNNDLLKGKDGMLKTVTDIRSVPLTIGDKNISIPAENGQDFVLTIDRNIQAKVERALEDGIRRTGATNASAIVMDPATGKVLAMSNYPTYDPSSLNQVSDVSVFNNNTISNPYEPGSDIKTLTMAMGIDKGIITPSSTYNNTDSIRVDDAVIGNASKGQTGNITMQHALNWSLNTGVVTVAMRLGDGNYITRGARDIIYDYFYNRYRFGRSTGVELSGESKGLIISPSSVQGNAVRYSNMVFGQGFDATMIQVSSVFSAIVNGGTYHAPTIIEGKMVSGKLAPAKARESYGGVVSANSSQTIRDMVYRARQEFYAGNDRPGFYIGGKTGTSQTIENGSYMNDQTIATYLGFGGEKGEIPRYVIMVEISEKGMNMQGSRDALPIFTDISNWMIDYLKLQPKG